MLFSFPPRFVATVTAATIAITSMGAVPAYANEDYRAARAVATLLGIAVIGSILNDRNDGHKEPRKAYREPVRTQGHVQRHRHGAQTHAHSNGRGSHTHRSTNNPRTSPKPLPRRVKRKLLPQNCLRSFDTRNGRTRLFTQACLRRNYAHINSLPKKCFRGVRTDQGKRKGFDARCLNRAGYSLARR
ncbi:hypothetical protein ABMC88_08805 [Sulfitobacter sp. HNIBRBA2951]|uniref:hypothetical protein n=1 Tax=Sulfitobacter aquimarinus TaxID=3158557 RepID=UPI0032DE7D8C